MKANILFATVPLDGHFNPLTSLAVHLRQQGHDVRWYTGSIYAGKLQRLGIPHYPFRKAREVTGNNLDTLFPERARIKNQIARLKFDLRHLFIDRAPEWFEDVCEIQRAFDFDLIVGDTGFTAGPLVSELLHRPLVSVGVIPLPETSRDLAPYGLALSPATTFLGRLRQAAQRFLFRTLIFKEATDTYNKLLVSYGLQPAEGTIFDVSARRPDLCLQSGVPGFEYRRRDMSPKVRFIGALLPHRGRPQPLPVSVKAKLGQYDRVILATQGTVETDVEKLLVPTLEAFKGTNKLLVVTTGGSQTAELRERYPEANIVIEDFVDFDAIMPHADVYVTNGGYGGTLLAISHALPMVCAGVHEGKNEVNARVGYFGLGIDLRTENPLPEQLAESVEKVIMDPAYKSNIQRLAFEFQRYNPRQLTEQYLLGLIAARQSAPVTDQAVVA